MKLMRFGLRLSVGLGTLGMLFGVVAAVLTGGRGGSESGRSVGAGPLSPIIDHGKSIYAMPLGMGRDEFVRLWGPPAGYLRLTGGGVALIYGANHAFLFYQDRLAGLCVSDPIVGAWLHSLVAPSPFDQVAWRLSNGITNRMLLEDVEALLQDRLLGYGTSPGASGFRYFRQDGMRVDLEFLVSVELPGQERRKVFGVLIRPE